MARGEVDVQRGHPEGGSDRERESERKKKRAREERKRIRERDWSTVLHGVTAQRKTN